MLDSLEAEEEGGGGGRAAAAARAGPEVSPKCHTSSFSASKKEASVPPRPTSRRFAPALNSCAGHPTKLRYRTIAFEMYDLPRAGRPT